MKKHGCCKDCNHEVRPAAIPTSSKLKATKQIIEEIFHTLPSYVEGMIPVKLEERRRDMEQSSSPDEGLRHANFVQSSGE